jgi:molybdate transport system substrate-binding protein
MKKVFTLLVALFLIFAVGCAKKEKPVTLIVSAASSLTESLNEIKTAFEAQSVHTVNFNFGASGTLQKQITEGAPADLFISAAKSNMDTLDTAGLLLAGTRKDLLSNTLVLVVSKEKTGTITLANLATSAKSIAIGTPESVPAGKYAKQALTKLNLWDGIQTKLILAKDVKQVLTYVSSGNADCGFVYATDAKLLTGGESTEVVPAENYDAIVYPVAVLKSSANPVAAKEFAAFLSSAKATTIFKKYGFTVK